MSKNRTSEAKGSRLRRLLSGVLCMALALSLLPGLELTAQAAAKQSWAMPYAQQLVDWGVMRGDISGNLNLDRAVTRAEFVTFINRAYGYTKLGGTPFTDVSPLAWYAQDIDIAYNVGYFKGVGPTTAAPLSPVTREQAGVFLSRNLMLQETVGETLGFSDSRTLSEWSRGLIGAAAASGVINGYSDGSFRHQQNITRGEVAAMLVRSIGTPINKAGDYSLGSVYGNVTINTSGVNLRNSVITGNLYLTGGVDLGDVLLENVKVLGQIIVSGAGESNSSQSSVLLRNVEADEMIVDSIGNQFVTIRAEGNTAIGKTFVRTNAYVDDSSLNGFGLSYIELDAENGGLLQLAGNVKEVLNKTPGSSLQIVQGSAQKVTVDEDAVGSNVLVDTNTRVDELDLDVATNVTGSGDIKNLNVGAAGSVVEQLPDDIYIRPGINADVNGSEMNNATGAESSAEPKLEAGFPKVKDVAPTSATMAFSTNKAGTVYWAVSAVADGSVSEENLISPPSYGGNIFKSGTVKADASKTEYTAQVSGLTTDGSYYVSAILVDSRGNRSPVKVTAFTTPDNTTPAFTTGYPIITMNTTDNVQVTAMTNKDCLLYWALLPTGSTAPKPAEFKANAISGNLGYGSVDMVKNVTQPINVNRNKLEELTKYDLYLWLTDHDGAKSSTVRKITFTTPDETPPVITGLEQNLQRTTATAVGVNYSLNEPGTLHWVIYADNATNAFATEFGRNEDDEKWAGEDVRAKAFVKAGLNSIKKGSSSASKADTDIAFAISGLNSKTTNTTSYMLYVVAEDKAGNLSVSVKALNVQTLDTVPPTVKQEFTEIDDPASNEPKANTSIRLVFDKEVQGDPAKSERFLQLYSKVLTAIREQDRDEEISARKDLGEVLASHIEMHYYETNGQDTLAKVRPTDVTASSPEWTVDYRYATVEMVDGKMIITLPNTANKTSENPVENVAPSALNLKSGVTYYFNLKGINSTALTAVPMNKGATVKLPEFRTVFASVWVNESQSVSIKEVDGAAVTPINIDFRFTVEPDSVESVADNMMWDMLLWTDTSMEYDLYSREAPAKGAIDTGKGWIKEGSTKVIVSGLEDGFVYNSFRKYFQCAGKELTFKQLNQMKEPVTNTSTGVKTDPGHGNREYAIVVTKRSEIKDTNEINMKVTIVAGYHSGLTNVAGGGFKSNLDNAKQKDGVATIGKPDPRLLYKDFPDTEPPKLVDNYPVIRVGDISATIEVMLDKPGYVYCVAVPLTDVEGVDRRLPMKGQENKVTDYLCSVIPTAAGIGKDWSMGTVSNPADRILDKKTGKPEYKDVLTRGPTAEKNGDGKIIDDKRYYLEAPDPEIVAGLAQQGNVGDRRGQVTGRLPANISNSDNPITLTGLTPDTMYLVYLVTQNTSGTSEGYEAHTECFRFTTEKAVRPGIDAEISGENVKISIYKTPTAKLDYILALRGSEPAGFEEQFYLHVETEKLAEVLRAYYGYTTAITLTDADKDGSGGLSVAGKNKVAAALAGNDRSFTVLDAMEATVGSGANYQGTIFDEYACTNSKNEFARRIRNQASDGNRIVMKSPSAGVTFTQANNSVPDKNMVTCTGMQVKNNYTFIAVGKSDMGSGDAFRAIHPLFKNDTEPPKVDLSASIITVREWEKNGDEYTGRIKQGTVTLAFTEELWAVQSGSGSSKSIPVDNCTAAAKGHAAASTQYQAVGGLVASTADSGVTVIGASKHKNSDTDTGEDGVSKAPINTITLNVSDADDGFGIVFRDIITDENSNFIPRGPLTVKIKIVPDKSKPSGYRAELEVPIKEWRR